MLFEEKSLRMIMMPPVDDRAAVILDHSCHISAKIFCVIIAQLVFDLLLNPIHVNDLRIVYEPAVDGPCPDNDSRRTTEDCGRRHALRICLGHEVFQDQRSQFQLPIEEVYFRRRVASHRAIWSI
jgi:hypothetical protein